MTEAEWLACTDPKPMLEELHGTASVRKLRLFTTACVRLQWGEDDAVTAMEGYVDGAVTEDELDQAWHAPWSDAFAVAGRVARWRRRRRGGHGQAGAGIAAAQASLLRDILGPLPFRPVAIDPKWLTWNYGTVPPIARRIYEERTFHDLPILADALEDAGCTDLDILSHCRGVGPHVRGCWVVDLVLGKE
jgi:hypothetical protein